MRKLLLKWKIIVIHFTTRVLDMISSINRKFCLWQRIFEAR